jgi:uncharacterized membrane protein
VLDEDRAHRRRNRRHDRVVPWAAAAILFAALAALSLLHHYTILDSYDLGYFPQAAWLITHGKPVFVTSRGLYLLGDHASPIFWPMAWTTFVVPTIPALLVIQAAALALGVVPLYAIARRIAKLPVLAATVVVAAYGLYPALNNVNLSDFHPEVVAVPALLGAMYFGLTRRWLPYAACVGVALLTKEDMTLVVASLGVFFIVERQWRAGIATAIVGLAWLGLDVKVIQPHYAGGFVQSSFLSAYGHGLGDIVRTMALHPLTVLGDLLTRQNLDFTIAILAPVLFLPLLAPKYLLPALPIQLLYLVSDRPSAHTIADQYTVAIVGFVFVAAAMALGRASAGDRSRLARTVLAAMLLAGIAYNSSLSEGGLSAHPWAWRHRDAIDRARRAGARLIPKGAAVAATDRLRPLIYDRTALYNFPAPFEGYEAHNDPVRVSVRQRRTKYLFLDTADGAQWPDDRRQAMERLVPELGFELIFDRNGILVFKR